MKEYRRHELKYYVIGNILFILLMTGAFDVIHVACESDINDINVLRNLVSVFLDSALFSSVLYVYVYIFDSMVPSEVTDKIVFFPSGRPGNTIFESILEPGADYRFTVDDARAKYKDVYLELDHISDQKHKEGFQNSTWYRIYQSIETNETVRLSQQDFLLNRDMCIVSLVMLALYIVFSLISGIYPIELNIIFWLIAEIIITKLAAMCKARRFVFNVIAKDIHRAKNVNNK